MVAWGNGNGNIAVRFDKPLKTYADGDC